MSLFVALAWPEPCLWPNRVSDFHWSEVSRAKREARHEAKIGTLEMLDAQPFKWGGGPVTITIVGHKPNVRRRDLQNFQSALKAHCDGIADALGVDDSYFVLTTVWGPIARPRGCVTVEII